jgi:hypothetical protein
MLCQVSDIPYSAKFGGKESIVTTLAEYISEVREHRIVGGHHPWYVFRGHTIPAVAEDQATSFVPYEVCPTPKTILEGFKILTPDLRVHAVQATVATGKASRAAFLNAQWALGGEGTGAPVRT